MPEEGLETRELKEALDEATEHAHGHGHGGGTPSWILALSLSTAIIAVLASIASLFAGSNANEALLDKNDAIHKQAEASDEWTRFQAKSIKADLYISQQAMADLNAAADDQAQARRAKAKADFQTVIDREMLKKQESCKTAVGFTRERDEKNVDSEKKFHVHHQFAYSVTIFQVAIALAAIAALARRKAMWFISLLAGAGAIFFLVRGFVPSLAGAAHTEEVKPLEEMIKEAKCEGGGGESKGGGEGKGGEAKHHEGKPAEAKPHEGAASEH